MEITKRKVGRPAGRKIKPVSTGVTDDIYDWLCEIALRDDRSVRYVVRELLAGVYVATSGKADLKGIREYLVGKKDAA